MRSASGIGLGLQKLASNYIAGFVILLDRSIRLGDLVTVDNRHGVVTEVTSRYVVVRSLDGNEAIVPNETLVTTTVLNHSFTNRDVRIARHDHGELRNRPRPCARDACARSRAAIRACRPRAIARRPRSSCASRDLGIELELGVWIRDPEKGQLERAKRSQPRDLEGVPGRGHRRPGEDAGGPGLRRPLGQIPRPARAAVAMPADSSTARSALRRPAGC